MTWHGLQHKSEIENTEYDADHAQCHNHADCRNHTNYHNIRLLIGTKYTLTTDEVEFARQCARGRRNVAIASAQKKKRPPPLLSTSDDDFVPLSSRSNVADVDNPQRDVDDDDDNDDLLFFDFVGVAGEVAMFRFLNLPLPAYDAFVFQQGNSAKYDMGDILLPNGESIDVKTTASSSPPSCLYVKLQKLQYIHTYYTLVHLNPRSNTCEFLGIVRGRDVCQIPFSSSCLWTKGAQPNNQDGLGLATTTTTTCIARSSSFAIPRCFLEHVAGLSMPRTSTLVPQSWRQWSVFFTEMKLYRQYATPPVVYKTTCTHPVCLELFAPLLDNESALEQILFRLRYGFADAICTYSSSSRDGLMLLGSSKRRWFSTSLEEEL